MADKSRARAVDIRRQRRQVSKACRGQQKDVWQTQRRVESTSVPKCAAVVGVLQARRGAEGLAGMREHVNGRDASLLVGAPRVRVRRETPRTSRNARRRPRRTHTLRPSPRTTPKQRRPERKLVVGAAAAPPPQGEESRRPGAAPRQERPAVDYDAVAVPARRHPDLVLVAEKLRVRRERLGRRVSGEGRIGEPRVRVEVQSRVGLGAVEEG
mmetsp:Transcript_13088/g.40364  ORF Transcript_13088/g.40364 Transcript_13088/m.40364 type:complete len:212 (-) Transcript_13088:244-879(-)